MNAIEENRTSAPQALASRKQLDPRVVTVRLRELGITGDERRVDRFARAM